MSQVAHKAGAYFGFCTKGDLQFPKPYHIAKSEKNMKHFLSPSFLIWRQK